MGFDKEGISEAKSRNVREREVKGFEIMNNFSWTLPEFPMRKQPKQRLEGWDHREVL